MLHFCSLKLLKKVEKIKPYNDSTSDYNQLLNKSSKVSMEVKRLRKLALEKLKTLNNLSPEYMKGIFYETTNLTHRPFNIKVNQNNTTKYGNKSLRSLVPHIWNSLPKQIKEETNYNKFKNYIHKWFGAKCNAICSCLNERFEMIFRTTSDLIRSIQKRFYFLYYILFRNFMNFYPFIRK